MTYLSVYSVPNELNHINAKTEPKHAFAPSGWYQIGGEVDDIDANWLKLHKFLLDGQLNFQYEINEVSLPDAEAEDIFTELVTAAQGKPKVNSAGQPFTM